MKYTVSILTLIASSILCTSAQAQSTILRHKNPAYLTESWAREFAESIEIPANARLITLSGIGALPANKNAKPNTVEYFGDTKTQTKSVLDQIEKALKDRGYSLADIVSVQGLFVADPTNGNQPDFDGFSGVYTQYFGTEKQPNLPTRTRAQVSRLVVPGWLIEITVTAAKVP